MLFWYPTSFHGHLFSPVLLIVAAAHPLVAVEPRHFLPTRALAWVALMTLVPGCAAGVILSPGWRNEQLQELLLTLGLVAMPAAALLSLVLAWACGRRR